MPRTPIHGIVLAGGQSSRMGRDKALLAYEGKPLIQHATERLHTFCTAVSISGNRPDLNSFAPTIPEGQQGIGPAAGLVAALNTCPEPWLLFTPVDVPHVPAAVLQQWAEAVQTRPNCRASYLTTATGRQPAFCMLHRDTAAAITAAVASGQHRLAALLALAGERPSSAQRPEASQRGAPQTGSANAQSLTSEGLWIADPAGFLPRPPSPAVMAGWFRNLNTPADLEDARSG